MSPQAAAWAFLAAAILAEVAATSALKLSDAASRLGWAGLSALLYARSFWARSFWALSHAFRHVPPSVAYAIWA